MMSCKVNRLLPRKVIRIVHHACLHAILRGLVFVTSAIKVLWHLRHSTKAQPTLSNEHRLPTIPVLSQSPLPAERSPSPAKNPESVNVHVRNLVRPFTERQLRDLLGKTGTLEEGGFWIDKIKSHCYAIYTDLEGATATRAALHGVKWPQTSPKILSVEFEDDEQMAIDTNEALGKKGKELEPPVREEDKVEKMEEGEKENPAEDDSSPADLLDNLFRKTKTTPCLYWLPLTTEQIIKRDQEREEKRKRREEERKKDDEERERKQREREKEREQQREREREREKEREQQARNRMRDRSRDRDRSRENRGGRMRSRSPDRRRRSSRSRSRSRSNRRR